MGLISTPKQLNQRAELYHQLGMMLGAGLSFYKALEHLKQHPPSRDLREPVSRLLEELTQGHTFTEALRHLRGWIPVFDIALIDAAEQSGRLDATLKLLSIYYRERAETARQLMSGLAYPLFVFNFAIVLFPLIDLITKGNFVRFFWMTAGIAVPLYTLVFLIIYACQGGHGEAWRSQVEKILSHVPVLGAARRDLALARLAAALESLLNAGIPIVTAWEMAAAASGSPALNRTVQSWKQPLAQGSTPSELVTESGRFPDIFSNLYHTGEVSGTLDDTLRRLHTLFQSEGLSKMKNLSLWTPKLIYFGIMFFVAWKIITYYTGYFNEVNQAINFR